MPVYLGYSAARVADHHATQAGTGPEDGVTPLAPGEDPLLAIDAATRDAIVNWTPVDAERSTEVTVGDRIIGGLAGAGIGAAIGFLSLNGLGTRRARAYAAAPMNGRASATWAGIGAAIGGIAGFARGRNPFEPDAREAVRSALPPSSTFGAPSTAAASHPAFASLHG